MCLKVELFHKTSVVVLYLLVGTVESFTKFVRSPCIDGNNISSNGTDVLSLSSNLQCARECLRFDCGYFDFCKTTETCVLYRILDGVCHQHQSDYQHYQIVQSVRTLAPKSCKDIYDRTMARISGVYMLFNNNGDPMNVFCDFYEGYGYTYPSKESLDLMSDLSNHYTDRSHVVIRHLRTDGAQLKAKVEQLQSYVGEVPLSFLLNNYENFTKPQNYENGPYLYLGFLPTTFTNAFQGYSAAGVDSGFTSSSVPTNSYFAVFSNPSGSPENDYWDRCCNSSMMHVWINQAIELDPSRRLPDDYFYQFEMHMGGSGGYTSTSTYTGTIVGAALGLPFK